MMVDLPLLNNVVSGPDHSDDWGAGQVLAQSVEERLIGEVLLYSGD